MLDPIRWPEKAQGFVLIGVIVVYVAASIVGPAGGPLVAAAYATCPALFGCVSWRSTGQPWSDTLSWTIPLLVWMASLVVLAPEQLLVSLAGIAIAGGWLALFTCWTPFVPWWRANVLRRPV
jgi:hypothetical protein